MILTWATRDAGILKMIYWLSSNVSIKSAVNNELKCIQAMLQGFQ